METKQDAESYCQKEVKSEWEMGMEQSAYQFV